MSDQKNKEILNKWQQNFDEELQKLEGNVRRLRPKIQKEIKMKVWLGGPGKDRKDNLYELRKLIGQFLENSNIQVVFSEDFSGCSDIVSKELEECAVLDATFLLCMSSGSSAESIEFAHDQLVKSKMNVYIPEEYKNGFVYSALHGHHILIKNDSVFDFDKFKEFDAELPVKILKRANAYRNKKYREKQMVN